MITMQESKTVSVILPNYNYAKYIHSRLDEILNQTYPVSEIIILDDASTDGSIVAIEQEVTRIKELYPNITIKTEYNKKNSGNVFSQWQRGINLVTSKYIWICELDDIAKPELLERLLKPTEDDTVVLSYCNSLAINTKGKIIPKENLRKIKDIFRKRRGVKSYVSDGITEINNNLAIYNSIPNVSAVVFKNQPELISILEEAKKYQLSGDWYFYLNVLATGKVAYSSRVLNYHRVHAESVTKSTDYKKRFGETQSIHEFVEKTFRLSHSTIKRITKIEAALAKNWKIKDN